jgi:hypothetical protein
MGMLDAHGDYASTGQDGSQTGLSQSIHESCRPKGLPVTSLLALAIITLIALVHVLVVIATAPFLGLGFDLRSGSGL